MVSRSSNTHLTNMLLCMFSESKLTPRFILLLYLFYLHCIYVSASIRNTNFLFYHRRKAGKIIIFSKTLLLEYFLNSNNMYHNLSFKGRFLSQGRQFCPNFLFVLFRVVFEKLYFLNCCCRENRKIFAEKLRFFFFFFFFFFFVCLFPLGWNSDSKNSFVTCP